MREGSCSYSAKPTHRGQTTHICLCHRHLVPFPVLSNRFCMFSLLIGFLSPTKSTTVDPEPGLSPGVWMLTLEGSFLKTNRSHNEAGGQGSLPGGRPCHRPLNGERAPALRGPGHSVGISQEAFHVTELGKQMEIAEKKGHRISVGRYNLPRMLAKCSAVKKKQDLLLCPHSVTIRR